MDGYHGGPNLGENLADVLNSIEVDDTVENEEAYIDPEQAVVTKIKRYVVSCMAWHSVSTCTNLSFYLFKL